MVPFVGRKPVLAYCLVNWPPKSRLRLFWERIGCGKTALLQELARLSKRTLMLYSCEPVEHRSPQVFLRTFAESCARAGLLTVSKEEQASLLQTIDADPVAALRALLPLLVGIPSQKPGKNFCAVSMFVDALSLSLDLPPAQQKPGAVTVAHLVMRMARHKARPSWLRITAATQLDRRIAFLLEPLHGRNEQLDLPEDAKWNKDDLREYVALRMAQTPALMRLATSTYEALTPSQRSVWAHQMQWERKEAQAAADAAQAAAASAAAAAAASSPAPAFQFELAPQFAVGTAGSNAQASSAESSTEVKALVCDSWSQRVANSVSVRSFSGRQRDQIDQDRDQQ